MTVKIVDHWYLPAKRVPSPNFNDRPAGMSVSLLVIHNISLPPGQFGGGYIEQFFCNRLSASEHPYFETIADLQVSAHLLIDRAGGVTQFVPFDRRAWHAGQSCYDGQSQCNDYSIGIELEGTDTLPYTEAQYQALTDTVSALLAAYPAMSRERICGHEDIAPGRKTDPGPAFDWEYFRELIGS